MALTTSTIAAAPRESMAAGAVYAYNRANVMRPLIATAPINKGSLTANWGDFTRITSSSVDSLTESADQTTITSFTSANRAATMSRYAIRVDLTDYSAWGNTEDLGRRIGLAQGDACAAKYDDVAVSLFSGFSQTVAGAATTLTLAHMFDAMRQLYVAGAPMPYNAVLSPKQIWGAKGVFAMLIQGGNSAATTSVPHSLMGAQGQEFLNRGFVTNLGMLDLYASPEIDEDVSSGGDAAGGIFSAEAIGMGEKASGFIELEDERDGSAAKTEYIANLWIGAIEIKDAFGVYALSDVS